MPSFFEYKEEIIMINLRKSTPVNLRKSRRVKRLTLSNVIGNCRFIDDETLIQVRELTGTKTVNTLANGNWFNDNILDFMDTKVTSFRYFQDNRMIVFVDTSVVYNSRKSEESPC